MDAGRAPAGDSRSLLSRLRQLLAIHRAHKQSVPCVQVNREYQRMQCIAFLVLLLDGLVDEGENRRIASLRCAPMPTMMPVQSAVERLISKKRIEMIMACASTVAGCQAVDAAAW